MEKYTIEITNGKIRKYLKQYKNYYKYYEPLFIQYLKENKNNLTEEILEILTDGKLKFENNGMLPYFDIAPSTIKNLDITGIYHILIPAIRYYYPDKTRISIHNIDNKAIKVADEFGLKLNSNVLDSVLNNYEICQSLSLREGIVTYNTGSEYNRCQLVAYETFYGEEDVRKVRKIIREGVR